MPKPLISDWNDSYAAVRYNADFFLPSANLDLLYYCNLSVNSLGAQNEMLMLIIRGH